MRTTLTCLLLGALLTPPLPPQVGPGDTLPELPAVQWLHEGPVPWTGAEAGAVTVLGCYRDLMALRQDLDHLGDLRRRLGTKGVSVAMVLVGEATAEEIAALKPTVPVATIATGDFAQLLFGDEWDRGALCVSDRQGQVHWIGQVRNGLSHAVGLALDGKTDTAANQRALEVREFLLGTVDDSVGADIQEQTAWLVQHNPLDGEAWALRYILQIEKLLDLVAARQTVADACKELAMAPAPLAAFADLALRSDPGNVELGHELVLALLPAAPAAGNDLRVQFALLRALVRAGLDREVGRLSRVLAKPAAADATAALTLAEILADDRTPAVHLDTATRALERAAALDADRRLLLAARYKVALRCGEDPKATARLFEQYVEDVASNFTLNNDAWYLMTMPATRGRFDVLALALAEKMLEHKEGLDYFEFDTVALAMFVNGKPERAVEYQKTAIEKGGGGSPEYQERLRRYEAALERQPAGKDKGGR